MDNDDLSVDETLDGSPFLRAHRSGIPEVVSFLKRSASQPFSSWPVPSRIAFGSMVRQDIGIAPSEVLKLCELPRTARDFQSLSDEEQNEALSMIFQGGPWKAHAGDFRWLDLAQVLTDGGQEALALHCWLVLSFAVYNDLRDTLLTWLRFRLWRGQDLEEYGRTIEKQWTQRHDFRLHDIGYMTLVNCRIRNVIHGARIEDWGLSLICRQDVTRYSLYRQPASWPESVFLPRVIPAYPTERDELRGTWVEGTSAYIYGQQEVNLDKSLEEESLDACAEICIGTQDDLSPGLPTPSHADTSAPKARRSRSQPAPHQRLDRRKKVANIYR